MVGLGKNIEKSFVSASISYNKCVMIYERERKHICEKSKMRERARENQLFFKNVDIVKI